MAKLLVTEEEAKRLGGPFSIVRDNELFIAGTEGSLFKFPLIVVDDEKYQEIMKMLEEQP